MIRNPFLKGPSDRFPEDTILDLDGIKGEFIGTDSFFPISPKLQSVICNNCLEVNKDEYLRFAE